jgi:hypothetical protein
MQKIKLFIESEKGKDIMTIIIVILVGISSFYLGRLSKGTGTNSLKIEYNGQETSVLPENIENPSISEKIDNNGQGSYFASKRGKKYYSIGCSAGKSIKQENKIYFKYEKEAKKAGYTLSTSC